MEEILKLAPEIHQNAIDKGFWENSNDGEKVMLIICELAEAVEADREGRIANIEGFEALWWKDWRDNINHSHDTRANYIDAFETCIKGSVGDELADAAIRLLDFTYTYGIDLNNASDVPKKKYDNFAEHCLSVTYLITSITFRDVRSNNDLSVLWRRVLYGITMLCAEKEIDLYWYMTAKMLYNKTRAYKHGKLY